MQPLAPAASAVAPRSRRPPGRARPERAEREGRNREEASTERESEEVFLWKIFEQALAGGRVNPKYHGYKTRRTPVSQVGNWSYKRRTYRTSVTRGREKSVYLHMQKSLLDVFTSFCATSTFGTSPATHTPPLSHNAYTAPSHTRPPRCSPSPHPSSAADAARPPAAAHRSATRRRPRRPG